MNKAEFIEKWLPSPLKNGGMFQSDLSALIEREKREAAVGLLDWILEPGNIIAKIELKPEELYDEYLKQQ